MILPELDQRPLFNAYNSSVENYDPSNSTVVATVISSYLCPEAPLLSNTMPANQIQLFDGTTYPAGSTFAKCNYAANWGGSQNTYGSDYTTTKKGSYLGVMMTVRTIGSPVPTNCIRAQDIRDGMANTLMVGEKRNSQGWNVGGYAGSEFDVGPSPYFPNNYRSRQTSSRPTRNLMLLQMVFPGSYHAGQTYFVFCDGSVHPLKSTIDKTTWYALTTRAGRELISSDAY